MLGRTSVYRQLRLPRLDTARAFTSIGEWGSRRRISLSAVTTTRFGIGFVLVGVVVAVSKLMVLDHWCMGCWEVYSVRNFDTFCGASMCRM